MTFFAIERQILRKGNKATPHIGVKGLNNIPVPLLNDNEQKPFIKLVNEILITKKSNPQADTTSLETQINQLVYDMYGLTDEDIQIVEESIG